MNFIVRNGYNLDNLDVLKKIDEKYGAYYKASSIIFNEDSEANKFYILRKGLVKITKKINDLPITINTIEKGEIFGEMGLITNKPRNASAITLTECFIISLNEENLDILIKSNKDFVIFLLKAFGSKIRYLSIMVKDLTIGNDFIITTTYLVNHLNTIEGNYNIKINVNDVLKHISMESLIPFEVGLKVLKQLEKDKIFKIRNNIIHITDKARVLKKIPRYF